ncbi:MAG: hypothetical protein JXR94_22490 [Candidatus Hydrogenedentes bacterium]|nr:hypothetical protein [Candidatus Hydrogenedentota bacterium]
MSEERTESAGGWPEAGQPAWGLRHVVALWLALTVALVPALFAVRGAERRVSRYHTGTFERYAREALAAGDFDEALAICTGALETALGRSDHWGTVFVLRAEAYAGLGQADAALAELESCADYWTRSPYYATAAMEDEAAALAAELGAEFAQAQNGRAALRAYSAGALVSGHPVEFLHGLCAGLPEEYQALVWPDEPFVILEDFESAQAPVFAVWAEEQGRELIASGIDPAVSQSGGASAMFEVSASTAEGRSWYRLPVHIPLSERPFALRVWVKEREPSDVQVALAYWFESARTSAGTHHAPTAALDAGWKRFDIERDFCAERLAYANHVGYSAAGGVINIVGLALAPGPANRYWVDRIDLYVPPSAKGLQAVSGIE